MSQTLLLLILIIQPLISINNKLKLENRPYRIACCAIAASMCWYYICSMQNAECMPFFFRSLLLYRGALCTDNNTSNTYTHVVVSMRYIFHENKIRFTITMRQKEKKKTSSSTVNLMLNRFLGLTRHCTFDDALI